MLLKSLLVAVLLVLSAPAWADSATTRDAMDRLGEVLELRIADGRIPEEAVAPILLVSARPRYAASEEWFTTRSIEVLQGVFGAGLRVCAACDAPRVFSQSGRMVVQSGPVGLDEVAQLDEQTRGSAPPARTAVWVDEVAGGISVRMVDLATGRVVFAQNIDPMLTEQARTQRMATMSEELERRARGDGLTQAFVDVAVFPGQHISLDWTDQWGPTNRNLSGVSLSLVDPVVGLGASHYRATRLFNTMVGAKVLVSLPTAVVESVAPDAGTDIIDPLLTAAGLVRVPFGRSNYGAVLSVSTNGTIGIGISLLNISLLPVIP